MCKRPDRKIFLQHFILYRLLLAARTAAAHHVRFRFLSSYVRARPTYVDGSGKTRHFSQSKEPNKMPSLRLLAAAALIVGASLPSTNAFVAPRGPAAPSQSTVLGMSTAEQTKTSTSTKSKSPMFEYLKFDGTTPTFDVIAKTKEYIDRTQAMGGADESIYDEKYVLRGPVIGPINRADLAGSQKGLGLRAAFPNVSIDTFGYTVDPENPYRVFYFQRWRAVHEYDLDAYGDIFPATGTEAEMPVSVFSVVWTPEGKIIYEQVGAVVDRLEGNTEGKAAVFGLLHTAGLKLNANPGDFLFQMIQRIGHAIGGRGRSWSREEDIPSWWVSKSRGADPADKWE